MKIKHQELDILANSPFKNCELEREQYALILTDIVNAYADGFVLAINNEWGTGKTTFVKMWQQHLKDKEFQTIYFNAWENDFDNNPLVAVMSELNTLTNKSNQAVFKSVVQKGAVLTKNILPALSKAVVKKYIDIDALTDAIENVTKGAAEIFEEEIKDYNSKKKSIIEFRKDLEKFIKVGKSEKPLIFIIDELDRCRPTYAIEVLEQIKHFFSVPGIVFVLSIDKNHLASSVRGFYGSESINTDEYLRRFIDLEYSIPAPSNKAYCKYLFTYYSFSDFFASSERRRWTEFDGESDTFLRMAELLFDQVNPTLRQQEKIFGQTRLILSSFKADQPTFSYLLFILIYIKTLKNNLYKRIEINTLSLEEIHDEFWNVLPLSTQNPQGINLVYIEALLLNFYNNNREPNDRITLFKIDEKTKAIPFIKSKLDDGTERTNIASYLIRIEQTRYSETSLNYLLNKINLTEPIILQ